MFEFILTVILIMPGDAKDKEKDYKIDTLEHCMMTAQSWLDQDPRPLGGVGLAAGCSKNSIEGRDAKG